MIVNLKSPVSLVPSIKKACRELEIDMNTGEVSDGYMECWFDIPDYGTLISIGMMAGMNNYHTAVSSPLKNIIEKMETTLANPPKTDQP